MTPDLEVIAAAFPTQVQAVAVQEHLARRLKRRGHDASVYQRSVARLDVHLVVAVVLAASGHDRPIRSRLRRKGGTPVQLPPHLEAELVGLTLEAIRKAA